MRASKRTNKMGRGTEYKTEGRNKSREKVRETGKGSTKEKTVGGKATAIKK